MCDARPIHHARRLAAVLEPVIGSVYFSPEVHDAYEAIGYGGSSGDFNGVAGPDIEAYFCSRAASMGQVSGAVVAGAFAVFNPTLVIPVVDGGWRVDAAMLATARVEAVARTLARVIGPANALVARTTELLERGAEGLPLPGRPLYAGLRGIGPLDEPWAHLHWAGDLLREHRGDSHTIAWTQKGLSACEIGLLSESYWGLPLRSYSRTRAWSDADYEAAQARLRRIGWLDAAGLTEEGRTEREAIEVTTDELCRPILDNLGDDLEELVVTLAGWADRIRAAGCYPEAGPIDLADAADV